MRLAGNCALRYEPDVDRGLPPFAWTVNFPERIFHRKRCFVIEEENETPGDLSLSSNEGTSPGARYASIRQTG